MQIGWNNAQKALRAEYARFGQEEIAARALSNVGAKQFDQAGWNALCASDFWRLSLPAAFGGLAQDHWDFAAAFEGLASTCGDGGFLMAVTAQAWAIQGLLAQGTEAQKHRLLRRLLKGEIAATAIAEPHSGTDVGALRTQAIKNEGGYSLMGQKQNISHAAGKGICFVLGRIPALGERDITLFLVDKSVAGYHAEATADKIGLESLPTFNIRMENVLVQELDVLGKKGEGLKALGKMMIYGRALMGIGLSVLLRPVLQEALAFIQDRESGGGKLRDHQYVQGRLAGVEMQMAQTRYTAYAALAQVLTGDAEAGLTASIAKLAGTESLIAGSRDLLAILGSRGYLEGPAGQLAKDALGFMMVGGTEEMHKNVIFRHLGRFH